MTDEQLQGERPFAVVIPDPESRGRWLFYVGEVFIDDCHTARGNGDYDPNDPALAAFREKASAINAAITGLTMSKDHASRWHVLLDAMEERGGESIPDFAKNLAVAMGIDMQRFPELRPRPPPPPQALELGAMGPPFPVRLYGSPTGYEGHVVAFRPREAVRDEIEIGARDGVRQYRGGPARIRLELTIDVVELDPRAPPAIDPALGGGYDVSPEVAAEILGLPPGSVLRGPTRTVEFAGHGIASSVVDESTAPPTLDGCLVVDPESPAR